MGEISDNFEQEWRDGLLDHARQEVAKAYDLATAMESEQRASPPANNVEALERCDNLIEICRRACWGLLEVADGLEDSGRLDALLQIAEAVVPAYCKALTAEATELADGDTSRYSVLVPEAVMERLQEQVSEIDGGTAGMIDGRDFFTMMADGFAHRSAREDGDDGD